VAASSSETSVITNKDSAIPQNTVILINKVVETSYRYQIRFHKSRHTKLRFKQTNLILLHCHVFHRTFNLDQYKCSAIFKCVIEGYASYCIGFPTGFFCFFFFKPKRLHSRVNF
jgi:hypothetical protein